MRQLKLRRTLTRLNQNKDQVDEVLQTNNKTQLIKEVKTFNHNQYHRKSLVILVRSSFISIDQAM